METSQPAIQFRSLFNPFLGPRFYESCSRFEENAAIENRDEECVELHGHRMLLAYVHQKQQLQDEFPMFNDAMLCQLATRWLSPVHIDTPLAEFCKLTRSVESALIIMTMWFRSFSNLLLPAQYDRGAPLYHYFVRHEWGGGSVRGYLQHVCETTTNHMLRDWLPKYLELANILISMLSLLVREMLRVNYAARQDWFVLDESDKGDELVFEEEDEGLELDEKDSEHDAKLEDGQEDF